MAKPKEEAAAVYMPDGTTLLVDLETGEALDELTRAVPAMRLQQMAVMIDFAISNYQRSKRAIEALLRREMGREAVSEIKTPSGKSKLIPGHNDYIGDVEWQNYKALHEPSPALVKIVESSCIESLSVAKVRSVFELEFGEKAGEELEALIRHTDYDYFRHTPILPAPPTTWPLKRADAEALIE